MAKSSDTRILKNNFGQSAVEYIMLLAVISSLAYVFLNNQRFKAFISGKDGMFAMMAQGMSYTYRYGVDLKPGVDPSSKMSFEYSSREHDTYFNSDSTNSRFFSGVQSYP